MRKWGSGILFTIILVFSCSTYAPESIVIPAIKDQSVSEKIISFTSLNGGHDPDFKMLVNSGPMLDWLSDDSGIPLNWIHQEDIKAGAYRLTVLSDQIQLESSDRDGKIHGLSTLSHLITPDHSGRYTICEQTIYDEPTYEYRGFMLDIARNFFSADEIESLLPYLWYLKINRLHLHLTDDQGWRIEIRDLHRLAEIGGQTGVDGDSSGYLTQEEYISLQERAYEFGITVIPEIDMPGHTNAMLVAYPEFAPESYQPEPYTGIEVGFSNPDFSNPDLMPFIQTILTELISMTKGDYIHIGGDEADQADHSEYTEFVGSVMRFVSEQGKIPIGWEEVAVSDPQNRFVAQLWRGTVDAEILESNGQILLSPAGYLYLDMKYDYSTELGLNWAGPIDFDRSMSFSPEKIVGASLHESIIGIEAPLWSETLRSLDDIHYMMFPRLFAYAEIAWNGRLSQSKQEFRASAEEISRRPSFSELNIGPF